LSLFAKEFTLRNIFSFGLLAAILFFCPGCGESKPPSTEAETEQLYESSEYEKEMMGGASTESNE
jgi:hypothetical protein